MFLQDMKIVQAVVLLGALAALASATLTTKEIEDIFRGENHDKILKFLGDSILDPSPIGGRRVETLDYYRVIPEEARIIADITVHHDGLIYPTFPCSAVIYIRHSIPLPPTYDHLGEGSEKEFFVFDPKYDLSCTQLRDVPQPVC